MAANHESNARWRYFSTGALFSAAVCGLLYAMTSRADAPSASSGAADASLHVAAFDAPAHAVSVAIVEPAATHTSAECAAVMSRFIASAPATQWPPPCPLPLEERAAFEGPDGSTPTTRDYCFAQRYEGGEQIIDWNEAYISKFCMDLGAGKAQGSYMRTDDVLVRDVVEGIPNIRGSTGMVLGSSNPWVECFGINAGAAAVWTFEYATIVSTHPKLKAKPCKTMAADHLSGALPLVDWIASYSSIEHSGLGRYGDALNPDGDKEALQQAFCMLKPGGLLVLGIPSSCAPTGRLEFNAHRVYGYKRWAHITEGFELVKFARPAVATPNAEHAATIIIFRKPLGPAPAAKLTFADFERAALAAA
jgi:hypothetical protein